MKFLFAAGILGLGALFASNFKGIRDMVKVPFAKGKIADRPEGATAGTKSLHDFTVKTLEGKSVSLSTFKGKKVVILNVASECGFTPQYADWQKFYDVNKSKIVVLGFPANNFGGQEPGSNKEIATFCQKNYGVTFPVFEKVSVKGSDKAPLYQWLTTKELNGWNTQEPSWNFCKYLVDENGQLVKFFASDIKPTSPAFLQAIK